MLKAPNMRIYWCGGCGINLASIVDFSEDKDSISVDSLLIDTSTSNYREDSGLDFHLIPGVAGMGKSRGDALNITDDKIDAILQTHKPGTVNVVVCSGGGGSGSVIGYQIARDLLSRGLPVVTCIVASKESAKDTDNSYKSMLALNGLVKKVNRPVPYIYFENDASGNSKREGTGTRNEVDSQVAITLRSLAELVSEKHEEFDRKDFHNFLYYDTVTDIKPQLTELILGTDINAIEALSGKVISIACTLADHDDAVPDLGQQYGIIGYYRENESGLMPANKYWMATAVNNVNFVQHLKEHNAAFKDTASSLNALEQIDEDDEDLF